MNRSLIRLVVILSAVIMGAPYSPAQRQNANDSAPRRGADNGNSQNRPGANATGLIDRWLRGDQDADGRLAKDEVTGLQKRFFDRNDRNGDGFLDRKELSQVVAQLAKNRAQANSNTRNQNTNRQPGQSIDQLRNKIPDGVTLVPDIAYREGHPRWKLDLLMPSDRGQEPRPAIVFVHGGGWRNGDKRAASFFDPAIEFASKGYVCISVNYRFLSDVQMMDTVADVKCAVRWLRAHADKYNVDVDRLGAYGNSAGAHLVSMLGLCPGSAGMEGDGPWQEHSSLVQAVCASATPTSFLMPMNNRMASTGGKPGQDSRVNSPYALPEELRKKVSPIHYASADAPPFLLIHDESDSTVLVDQAKAFAKALKESGAKDITLKLYDNRSGHGAMQKNIAETGPLREAFFARTLGNPTSSQPQSP
tara:strand:- start:167618 stop:168874 length:1257 start_codon:yes stop_codon:yes gene_type:complete